MLISFVNPHCGVADNLKGVPDNLERETSALRLDGQKGLVLGASFIDHSDRKVDITRTCGTGQKSPFTYPHSYVLLELFKIEDDNFQQTEAVFAKLPY